MVILFLAQIAAATAFIIFALQLPPNPQPGIIDPISLVIGLLLVLMCVPSVLSTWKKQPTSARVNTALIYAIVLVVAFVALITTYPASKTRGDAIAYNSLLNSAAEYGAKVGITVREQNPKPVKNRPSSPSIPTEYSNNPAVERVLERAFNLAQQDNSDKSADQIASQANPTIPLLENQWSCISIGCAYTTADHVWTSSTQNRAVGAIALVVSIMVGILSANEATIRSLRRHEVPRE